MGATPCKICGIEPHIKITINTQVKDINWADAVLNNSLAGVTMLHQNDPDTINKPIDTFGCTGLHYSVKQQNEKLLLYLLEHGANINTQAGKDYNSALHEAVLVSDFKAVSTLFKYDIQDQLKNNENKVAIDLCPNKEHTRLYIQAKEHGISLRNKNALLKKDYSSPSNALNPIDRVSFHGLDLDHCDNKAVKRILKETDDIQLFFKSKREEIKSREYTITDWGDECGIEIDEIALVLIDEAPDKIWNKLTKKKECVTKQTDIYKILYGLTASALKKRIGPKKPPSEPLKKLTRLVCKQLPKNKGKPTLDRELFEKKFHQILFDLHKAMVDGDELFSS